MVLVIQQLIVFLNCQFGHYFLIQRAVLGEYIIPKTLFNVSKYHLDYVNIGIDTAAASGNLMEYAITCLLVYINEPRHW